MSKFLSKVLMICAMIVIVPLMIAGTTYAAYYSIDATIAVDLYTNRTNDSQGAFAKVFVNDKEVGKNTEFVDGHLKNAVFSAQAKGYNFVGWFNGTERDYAIAHENGNVEYVSEDAIFETGMKDYANLLAVFEVKKVNVSYSYKATPTADEVTESSSSLDWGDELLDLKSNYDGYGYQFKGWKVKGTQSQPTTVADFEEDVTLEAVWQEAGKITVNYKNGKETLKQIEIYENEPYTVESVESVVTSKKAGYKYSWVDANGETVSEEIVSSENVDIYLQEEAIEYSVAVDNKGFGFNGSLTFKFSDQNRAGIEAIFNSENWNIHSFDKFNGIKFNNETKTTADDLVSAILNANINGLDEEIKLEVSIEREEKYNKAKITGKVSSTLYGDGYAMVQREGDLGTVNAWSTYCGAIDASKTLEEALNLKGVTLYTGTKDNKTAVEICQITFDFNDHKSVIVSVNKDMTFQDVMERLINVRHYEIPETGLEISNVLVMFKTVA